MENKLPVKRRSTFMANLFSHFLIKQLDEINAKEFKDCIFFIKKVGISMQDLLIQEITKPTITEIKKNKLSEYEERNLDVRIVI
jgi:hypothetical protein